MDAAQEKEMGALRRDEAALRTLAGDQVAAREPLSRRAECAFTLETGLFPPPPVLLQCAG